MSHRTSGWLWLLLAVAPLTSLAHDDLERQIERLDRAIRTSPAEAGLYLQRAALHHAHQDTGAALADLELAEARDPDLVDLWLLRGRVLLESGRAMEALPALDRHLDRHPEDGLALALRAGARGEVGDLTGAEEDYAAAAR